MAKIVIFLENGKTTPESITKKVQLAAEGHSVTFSNGSMDRGFEDSCDKIIMCCENEKITKWATRNFIEIETLNMETVSVPTPTGDKVDVTISMLDAAGKANGVKTEEPNMEEKKIPKSLPAGLYVDPEGKQYVHKGRAFKVELRNAIEEYGVENIKLIENRDNHG